MRRQRVRGHAGETLAEVLVTTTLLGIVGVGVIGTIASILISSDADRQWSHGETVMRSFAATVEHADYVDCTTSNDPYGSIDFATPRYSNGAAQFSVRVDQVESWNGAGPSVVPPPSEPAVVRFRSCTSGDDMGLQRVRLRVEHLTRNGAPDTRAGLLTTTIYKRDEA